MTITTTKMMRMRLATKGVERAGGMTVQLESCEVEINPKHTSKRGEREWGQYKEEVVQGRQSLMRFTIGGETAKKWTLPHERWALMQGGTGLLNPDQGFRNGIDSCHGERASPVQTPGHCHPE